MNKIVIVVFVCVIVSSIAVERGPRSEEFKKDIEACKAETGATDDDVKTLITRHQMSSKSGWCLVACMKKKSGVMDASNKIDMAKLKEQMSVMKAANSDMYNKFIGVMEECKKAVEADPTNIADKCTAAQMFGQCFYKKKAAAGIP